MAGISLSGLSASVSYQIEQSQGAKKLEQFQKDPALKREIAYFQEKAPNIKSVDDLFKDRRLMGVILSAYGLDSEMQFMGRIKKVMTSNLEDPSSLANKLRDPKFKALAKDFNLDLFGVSQLKISDFTNKIISKYKQNEYDKALGNENPALRETVYLKRNIGNVKNAYDILGDPVLRKVITATFNIPPQLAVQEIETQKRVIDSRVDIKKLSDTKYVDGLIKRYLTTVDAQGSQSASATSWQNQLISGAGGRLSLLA
ncbi:MAG: DUF1217 domain-containing protein [Alphaproteobacteria bacterium]